MDDQIRLESLCGEHYLSGVEMTYESVGRNGTNGVLLFSLDDITYKLVEDPSDGFRSYCKDIEISDVLPKFSFPPVKVICSMMENDEYEVNECIVIRDALNGKTILEAGTKNCNDWYPYCHFSYTPENMACNQRF